MTTSTFNPSATGEDGDITGTASTTFATARGTSASCQTANTSNVVQCNRGSGAGSWTIRRAHLRFNTASIPDGDEVTSVKLRIYVTAVGGNGSRLTAATYGYTTALCSNTESNYDAMIAGTSRGTIASCVTSAYNEIVLAVATVNKTGYTDICLVDNLWDWSNNGTQSKSTNYGATFNSQDNASNKPELVVVHAPPAQTVTPTTAVASAVANSPTGTAGAVALTPTTAVASAVANSPTRTAGAVALTPTTAVASAVANGPSVTQGSPSVTVTPATAVASAVANSPTRTAGAVALTPTTAVASAVGLAVTLTLGAVALTPGTAVASAVGNAPTRTAGAVALTPGTAVASAVGSAPTRTAGAVALTPATAVASAVANAPTRTAAVALTPTTAVASAVGNAPTRTAGAVALTPGTAVASVVANAPTRTAGAVALTPGTAVASAVGNAPTRTAGAVALTPGTAAASAVANAPSVTLGTGGASVTPATAVASAVANAPTRTAGAVAHTPATAVASAVGRDPAAVPGAVARTPATAAASVVANAPTRTIGAVALTPGTAAASVVANAPTRTVGAVARTPATAVASAVGRDPVVRLGGPLLLLVLTDNELTYRGGLIMRELTVGATSVSVTLRMLDSSSGSPETGVGSATPGLSLWYQRGATGSIVPITPVDLTSLADPYTPGGIYHRGDGYYRVDIPNAAVAAGASTLLVSWSADLMVGIGQELGIVEQTLPEDVAEALVGTGYAVVPITQLEPGEFTRERGNSWDLTITVAVPSPRDSLWLGIKKTTDYPDAEATLLIEEVGGLEVLLGATPTGGQAAAVTLVVDEGAGTVTLSVEPSVSALLPSRYVYVWELICWEDPQTRNALASGTLEVTEPVVQGGGS